MNALSPLPESAPLKLAMSVDTLRFPLTGIGRYTLELAAQLARRDDLDLLCMRAGTLLPGLPQVLPGTDDRRRVRDLLSRFGLPVEVYRRWSEFTRARALRGHADRLFHGTNFYAPTFKGRCVLTLHDASVRRFAHTHRQDRVRFMLKEVERSLRQTSMVITVSEFARREIAELWDWPHEAIRVTPLAASEVFRPHSDGLLACTMQRLNLRARGYCLYVGTVEPRKNLGTLLDAYVRLPLALRQYYPLVVAGYRGWESDTLHHRLQQAAAQGWLCYLGFVEDSLLPALVAGARLFVFPSRYEGFGLPVLEAMASGVAVVCSDAASLPEVGGAAARYVPPDDVDGWQQHIQRALEDDHWRQALVTQGLAQAAQFSWRRCADLTVAAYREVQAH